MDMDTISDEKMKLLCKRLAEGIITKEEVVELLTSVNILLENLKTELKDG